MEKNQELAHYQQLVAQLPQLRQEIGKVIVGQQQALNEMLIALLAGGHCLLEGVPGLAKTLMVKTTAEALAMDFKRIQFTPDLMPGDIVGTEILEEDHETGRKFFKFNQGPLFAHVVLADEINRTPPKTQAALLEAMQEGRVTYAGVDYPLPRPFFIIATQNPIEQAGTYPLPEAQLDRFLLYIKLNYPSETEELQVLRSTTGTNRPVLNTVLSDEQILDLQRLTRQVHISDELLGAINRLVRATRPEGTPSDFVKQWCDWGAGPRAGQALVLCAKANAVLHERFAVVPDDIRALAFPVLRHRIALNFKAEAEGITPDRVIEALVKEMKL
ncbi:MoxR family ATPase [Rhabdobacter roseus]|uniref:MoxR-like ATPase n=1 Tax=Rhabdobacter roseus TaxID=1655419 RepID=A0A840TPJ1_9BACT|nr:MoxR family ATPase [Rhabdobacter roseus]MBB5281970.1 MoxR-like ATPase [Rhabdobacter roseus]